MLQWRRTGEKVSLWHENSGTIAWFILTFSLFYFRLSGANSHSCIETYHFSMSDNWVFWLQIKIEFSLLCSIMCGSRLLDHRSLCSLQDPLTCSGSQLCWCIYKVIWLLLYLFIVWFPYNYFLLTACRSCEMCTMCLPPCFYCAVFCRMSIPCMQVH